MIYAIGDLHLSDSVNKPMDVFGDVWKDHQQRIMDSWSSQIGEHDVVLIPGDISWAMTLHQAVPDLEFIGHLPGVKVMIRGNHDYWWSGISKVRAALPESVFAVQNDSCVFDDFVVCGTRGWLLPAHPQFREEDDTRLLDREAERLRLSLQDASRTGLTKVCMIHYPPLGPTGESTVFTDLMEEFDVSVCVYGHLHGQAHRFRFEGEKNGVTYQLTSADYVSFQPVPVTISD